MNKRIYAKRSKNPEWRKKNRAALKKARAARDGLGRLGIPDGWTRAEATLQREYDYAKIDLLLERMRGQGMIDPIKAEDYEKVIVKLDNGKEVEVLVPITDSGKAQVALREAMVHAISPLTHANNRSAHIRTVLEWTRAKPAAKTDVRVNDPQAWLDAAMQDANEQDDGTDEGADQAP